MLKSLLNRFLNIHHNHQHNIALYEDLFTYASQKQTFCTNMYVLNHTHNKFKYSLKILSHSNPNHLYPLMIITASFYLFYYKNSIIEEFHRQQKKFQSKEVISTKTNKKPPLTGSTIVINEVLRKQQINKMLGELIVKIDNRQSTHHNIAKQLCKLGNITFLYNKTYILTKDLLIQQVFNSEDIQLKFRDLLIKVMKDQKHQIVNLLTDQMKNNLMKIAVLQLTNLYDSEGFQQGLSNALIGTLYGYLDDRNTVIELLKLIQSE